MYHLREITLKINSWLQRKAAVLPGYASLTQPTVLVKRQIQPTAKKEAGRRSGDQRPAFEGKLFCVLLLLLIAYLKGTIRADLDNGVKVADLVAIILQGLD